MQLVIVTGMSGAGKSRAMDSLEDIGFFCVDNMTPELIPAFVQIINDSAEIREKVAIAADVRLGESFSHLFSALDKLQDMNCEYKILFVDATDDVILRRYQETRRKHPLSVSDSSKPMQDIIADEREMLKKARDIADFVIDSSFLSTAQLKERIAKLFTDDVTRTMKISIVSFGFKYGSPKDSDLLFDVRCLPNPFYIPELKQLTGLDKGVRDFVMNSEKSAEFERRLFELVDFVVPECIREGKSQLVIAVGCTGGHHRSVTFAEALALRLKNKNYNVSISHRDIKK